MKTLIGSELLVHCHRVAFLCVEIGRQLGIAGDHLSAIHEAGMAHEDFLPLEPALDEGAPNRRVDSASILWAWQGIWPLGDIHPTVKLCAQILEACDSFDSAAEFSTFEREPLPVALAAFLAENDCGAQMDIRLRLSQIVSPGTTYNLQGELPVLPSAVTKLMRTSAESVTVAQLEAIAQSDPILGCRVLTAANSVCLGSRWEVTSIRAAISRLGTPLARRVLMAAGFGQLFASNPLKLLWDHSRLVAATACELAGSCGYDQDTAYTAGLLHDIGRLVFVRRFPGAAQAREAELRSAYFPLVYAETLAYGADHAAIGADLLRHWNLPSEIVDAVEYHHRPEATEARLAGLLTLAEDTANPHLSEAPSSNLRKHLAIQSTRIAPVAAEAGKNNALLMMA